MCRTSVILGVISCVLLALAMTVRAEEGPIGRNFIVEPMNGASEQWEMAYKKHVAWHRENHDNWNWDVYQIESGPRFGQYFIRTSRHNWQDFDARSELDKKDTADFEATAGKFTRSTTSWFDRSYWNLSRLGEGGGINILEYVQVVVEPKNATQFLDVVSKFHTAFQKARSPARYVIMQTESGGQMATFVVVGLHKNWASLEQGPTAITRMMGEVYGPQEAEVIIDQFLGLIEEMESFILRRRLDLSYVADEK